MRSDTYHGACTWLCWQQHVAQTLCRNNHNNTKRRWQQAGATVQPELHNDLVDVCAYSDGLDPSKMLQAVPGCAGKTCAYGSIQNSLQTAAPLMIKTCWCTYVRMHACLRVLTRSNIPGCCTWLCWLGAHPVQAVTTQQLAASSKHLHKNKTGCPAC
jgi:hypothetical protein